MSDPFFDQSTPVDVSQEYSFSDSLRSSIDAEFFSEKHPEDETPRTDSSEKESCSESGGLNEEKSPDETMTTEVIPSYWATTSIPKESRNYTVPKPPTSKPKTSRRYKNMIIRNHDDMLQEQYQELKRLLNDVENCSREQLYEEHVEQSKHLIEGYKQMSGGSRARSILICHSLPEGLRPKSPRSRLPSRDGSLSGRGHYSRSPSLDDNRHIKRVTFKSPRQVSSRCLDDELSDGVLNNTPKEKHAPTPQSKPKRRTMKLINTKRGTPSKEDSHDSNVTELDVSKEVNCTKRTDNSIKHSKNSDIKKWMREKEKLIRGEKKRNRMKEKKLQQEEEKKRQEQENRRIESEKKLREWQKNKRREALLIRRERAAQRKLERSTTDLPKKAMSENDVSNGLHDGPSPPPAMRPQQTAPKQKKVNNDAPIRPQSAPGRQAARKSVGMSQEDLLKANPDLKKKLDELEKQKRFKYRQSYEEWCKVKEKEKKDTLKSIREQRQKLEKEISEETAKVISEAARRRMDNIRFKGADEKDEEKKEPNRAEKKQSFPKPYTWNQRHASDNANRPQGQRKQEKTMPQASSMPEAKTKSRRINIEDRIPDPDTASNPFKPPFKPPKLKRPKSKLEREGVNGPDFSQFIWNLVNEEANGSRPEPQGSDSPTKSSESANKNASSTSSSNLKPPQPEKSKSPVPPTVNDVSNAVSEPVIETGKQIFSMTSIE